MSVLREELNVKAIWEAQPWGTHYVTSFYRLPSEMTKFKVREGRFHLHSSYSETVSICDHVYKGLTAPVFCHQAVDEGRHQDLAEVGSDAEPETPTERHEMLCSTGDFRLILQSK